MIKNKILFFSILLFIFVSMFGVVRSLEMLTSSANVSYDSYILEQFNNSNSSWVNIFFRLNNASDADYILSNFSDNEIKNIVRYNITPDMIALTTTQEGFNKLINDSRIKEIYYSYTGTTESPSCSTSLCISNTGVEYEIYVLNAFNNSKWVTVGIDIYSKNLTLIDNILSNLSASEFNLSLKLDDGFYGSITKEGFDRIINNPEIKSIYRSVNAQIAQNQSGTGSNSLFCGYITCDNLTYQRYQKILKEFNTVNWVPVIVEMFSAEKTDNFISSLLETDFKNVKKELSPNVFTVEVTKIGLDELFNNSGIKTINLQESLSSTNNNSIESKFNWIWIIIPVIIILIILGIFFIKRKKL